MTKATAVLTFAALALQSNLVAANIHDLPGHEWMKPGAGDLRSPCPGLNVLANHGFLPRSGRNITKALLKQNIQDVYNLDDQMAEFFAQGGVTVNGPEQPEITLADLSRHDSIEHDASLTRDDARTGDNHSLQPRLLQALLDDAKGDTLTMESLATSRNRRTKESEAGGSPSLGLKMRTLAYGETALILQALGRLGADSDNPSFEALRPPKDAVRTWIGEERLPNNWVKPLPMTLASTTGLSSKVLVAANSQAGGPLGFAASAPIGLLQGLFGGAASAVGALTRFGTKERRAVEVVAEKEKRYYGHGMWA